MSFTSDPTAFYVFIKQKITAFIEIYRIAKPMHQFQKENEGGKFNSMMEDYHKNSPTSKATRETMSDVKRAYKTYSPMKINEVVRKIRNKAAPQPLIIPIPNEPKNTPKNSPQLDKTDIEAQSDWSQPPWPCREV
uniref:Uncharacterized protein n=1 Tax=Romanomermis culicivorax TaxID=13658 RepID=A0A915JIH2_ROMCU